MITFMQHTKLQFVCEVAELDCATW